MSKRSRASSRSSSRSNEKRPWTVTAVFDPDGTGQDFGYTIGLAKLGQPELHMWARPTHGTDPGADFKLSPRDIRAILNIHAEMLLNGELDPGSEFVRDLDAGMTEARITVGEAVHPREVDALGAQPGASVLPLRWELIREPEGHPTPVSPQVQGQIERLAIEWRRVVEDLGGSVRPGRPDTRHTQRYGPWTPAIEAAREAIGIVGGDGEISWCIDILADRTHEIGNSVAVAAALARRHGRCKAFDAATTVAFDDADAAITTQDSLWVDMTNEEIEYFLPEARYVMGVVLNACYGHMVVLEHLVDCDGIDPDLSAHIHATVLSVVREAAYPTATPWPESSWPDTDWLDADWPDAGWPDAGWPDAG